MKLHENSKNFDMTLRSLQGIFPRLTRFMYIKDYHVTKMLHNFSLATQLHNIAILKGGTSLSKSGIIERFSEDIDVVLQNATQYENGNQIKRAIRKIDHTLGAGFEKTPNSEAGTNIRKSFYQFTHLNSDNIDISPEIQLEINSFASLATPRFVAVESLIAKALKLKGLENIIQDFSLEPFQIPILDPKITFAEKVTSLIRWSLKQNPVAEMNKRVRHIYDLTIMLKQSEYQEFVANNEFIDIFRKTITHDLLLANKSDRFWILNDFTTSFAFSSPEQCINVVYDKYSNEFSEMVYGQLPTKSELTECLYVIQPQLQEFERVFPIEERAKLLEEKHRATEDQNDDSEENSINPSF